MANVSREKYVKLMAQIEDLEDRVADLTNEEKVLAESDAAEDLAVVRQELRDCREELAEKKNELSRISDGCGKPHPM